MILALASAIAGIIAASLTVFLTKKKEREAEWRSKKLAYYEEFFAAVSGIVGDTVPDTGHMRFANAVNKLHLVASQEVVDALHLFLDETAVGNKNKSMERQHRLWSNLVWHIRNDMQDCPAKPLDQFEARLWASGTGSNA